MSADDRRVRITQQSTARGLVLGAAFALVAGGAAIGGADRWAVLHLALAGGGASVISAASLHLALTWSGAPAPAAWASDGQRWLLAASVTATVVGRTNELDAVTLGGTTGVAVALVWLAGLLVQAAARARQQRYRVQVWSYAVAAGCGALGAVGGGLLATDHLPGALWRAHPIVMLWGFVGTIIVATLPTFAATTLRMKPSPWLSQARLGTTVAVHLLGTVVAVTGALTESGALGVVGLAAAASATVVTVAMLPRPTRRAYDYAGPRGIGLGAAIGWWVGATVQAAVDAGAERWPTSGRAVIVLLLGGAAQLIWAAVAYFGPVLRGGGPARLAEGFALTRSWPALVAWNVAAVGAASGTGWLAAAGVGVAVVDTVVRAALLLRPPRAATAAG